MLSLLFNRQTLNIFLCCLISISGCENKKDTPTPTPYSFSYTGSTYAEQTINFTSNAIPGSNFTWKFGDGTSSAEANPAHVYSAAGTYKVTLSNPTDSVTKTIKIGVDSVKMSKVTSTRIWHHSYHFIHFPSDDTTYYYGDTSFSVFYVDPVTVAVGTDTLLYSSSNDTLVVFEHSFSPHYKINTLYCYTVADKMRYTLFDHNSAGSNSTRLYWTP